MAGHRRVLVAVAICVGLGAASFAGGWAAKTLAEPLPTDQPAPQTTVTVTTGEIAAAVTLGASARWNLTPLATNLADGVLTTAPAATEVSEGQTLYTVDLRPTFAALGTVPMFRDIGTGATGADVTQLQGMLSRLGYYTGPTDGAVRDSTVRAIRRWQRDVGLPVDGLVRSGDVAFVAELPAMVSLADDVVVGDKVAPGEIVLERYSEQPRVVLSLSGEQAALAPVGVRVSVTAPDGGTWSGRVGAERTTTDAGPIEIPLVTDEGEPICADACESLPRQAETVLAATVYRQEPVTGLTLPVTAIETDGAGATSVRTADGQQIVVKVLATSQGMAAVEGKGLREGSEVLIRGDS